MENGTAFDKINECGAILSVKAKDVVWEKGEFYIVCKYCKNKINVSNIIPQFLQASIAHQKIANCL